MTGCSFKLLEATIPSIHRAFLRGEMTSCRLTESYLERISAYEKSGPAINSIISINPSALDDAKALDMIYLDRGRVGPLHGIPILIKDQIDTVGMPTTLGSELFKDYFPDRDATVVSKLRSAGAVILGKTTLGELGGGDAHGSLYGSTRNPYDLKRTAGGSSGGSGAAMAANLAAISLGQEGLASIRRPSAWNSIVGMRPSLGLVSRAGAFGGYPERCGSIGPMTRTVSDLAHVLDVLVGYDSEDPATSLGYHEHHNRFVSSLLPDSLAGARIGIIRQSIGLGSDPDSADYGAVSTVFERAVDELQMAGATVIDVDIPNLNELLVKRCTTQYSAESFMLWMGRSKTPPYKSYQELTDSPLYTKAMWRRSGGGRAPDWNGSHYDHLIAQEQLRTRLMQATAEHALDAFCHKSVEHTPTLIRDGINPPYRNHTGAPTINTLLEDVPSISVPAGYTPEGLPVGITFLGSRYRDHEVVSYAYAYEQTTRHREPPESTPAITK